MLLLPRWQSSGCARVANPMARSLPYTLFSCVASSRNSCGGRVHALALAHIGQDDLEVAQPLQLAERSVRLHHLATPTLATLSHTTAPPPDNIVVCREEKGVVVVGVRL